MLTPASRLSYDDLLYNQGSLRRLDMPQYSDWNIGTDVLTRNAGHGIVS